MSKHVMAMLKVLTFCGGLMMWAGVAQGASSVFVTLDVDALTVGPGNTLSVRLFAQNIGPTVTGDFYFLIVHPDGVNATFIVNLNPVVGVERRLDQPATFPPLVPGVVLASGADFSIPNFFVYTMTGGEPLGSYRFYGALAAPRAFVNNEIAPNALFALGTDTVIVSSQTQRPTGPRR